MSYLFGAKLKEQPKVTPIGFVKHKHSFTVILMTPRAFIPLLTN
jgi:hypothetical protein